MVWSSVLLFLVNYMTVRLLLTHNKSLFLLLVYCKPSKQTIQNILFTTYCTARGYQKLCLWHLVCSCLMHQSAVMLHYLHKELTFRMRPQVVSRKPSHYTNQNIKKVGVLILAISELRKRPGNSDVDNASRDCFWGQTFVCVC